MGLKGLKTKFLLGLTDKFFWDISSCQIIYRHRSYVRAFWRHLQGRKALIALFDDCLNFKQCAPPSLTMNRWTQVITSLKPGIFMKFL